MKPQLPTLHVQADHAIDEVARDGIVLCFFMRRSHGSVIHAVWRALQTYRRAIPTEALGWYPDNNGDYQPLDTKGWNHIHATMLDQGWPAQCSVELNERCEIGRAHV